MVKNKKLYASLGLVAAGCLTLITVSSPATETSYLPKNAPLSATSIQTGKNQENKQNAPRQNNSSANSGSEQESDEANAVNSSRSQNGAIKTKDKIITKDGKVYPLRTYEPLITPNDPLYNQWWVPTNGMTSVWGMAGSTQTTVAVIDTGFALGHQEFANRWAVNTGESGATSSENPSRLNCTDQGLVINRSCNLIDDNFDGIVDNESGATSRQNPSRLNCTDQGVTLNKSCNGIDDDGNGLIDDYSGWDFSNFDAKPQAGEVNPNGSGTTHGTMVAGILGASGNNGVGIAGVNWQTKILPIQALDDYSYGDSYTVGEAIYYAADQGVDVISISLGTSYNDPYLRLAILYALDRGVAVVSASGNSGCNCMSYPAKYPEVIAVGSVASNGNPSNFNSYGAELDILAPGQSVTTSTFSSSNQTSAYATGSGTSFATPYISGLLALGRSHQPNANWEEIVGAMFEQADRKSLSASSPRNNTLGFGVTRSDQMLARVMNPHNSIQRYQISGGTILGSTRAYQCDSSEVPASRYYQLKKSGQYRYTANQREYSKAVQAGWAPKNVGYFCMGLPTDTFDVLRLIDLPKEILNITTKQ